MHIQVLRISLCIFRKNDNLRIKIGNWNFILFRKFNLKVFYASFFSFPLLLCRFSNMTFWSGKQCQTHVSYKLFAHFVLTSVIDGLTKKTQMQLEVSSQLFICLIKFQSLWGKITTDLVQLNSFYLFFCLVLSFSLMSFGYGGFWLPSILIIFCISVFSLCLFRSSCTWNRS